MTSLSVEWTQGMDPEQKKAFEQNIRNNSVLVNRFLEIIDRWEKETTARELTIDDFKEPNWANKQAFRNGDKSRIKKVKDLFTL